MAHAKINAVIEEITRLQGQLTAAKQDTLFVQLQKLANQYERSKIELETRQAEERHNHVYAYTRAIDSLETQWYTLEHELDRLYQQLIELYPARSCPSRPHRSCPRPSKSIASTDNHPLNPASTSVSTPINMCNDCKQPKVSYAMIAKTPKVTSPVH